MRVPRRGPDGRPAAEGECGRGCGGVFAQQGDLVGGPLAGRGREDAEHAGWAAGGAAREGRDHVGGDPRHCGARAPAWRAGVLDRDELTAFQDAGAGARPDQRARVARQPGRWCRAADKTAAVIPDERDGGGRCAERRGRSAGHAFEIEGECAVQRGVAGRMSTAEGVAELGGAHLGAGRVAGRRAGRRGRGQRDRRPSVRRGWSPFPA